MRRREAGDAGVLLIVFIAIIVVVVLVIAGSKSAQERQAWLDANCKVVGEVSGSTAIGYTSAGDGGVVTTYTAGKTGYECNDGKTYWE